MLFSERDQEAIDQAACEIARELSIESLDPSDFHEVRRNSLRTEVCVLIDDKVRANLPPELFSDPIHRDRVCDTIYLKVRGRIPDLGLPVFGYLSRRRSREIWQGVL